MSFFGDSSIKDSDRRWEMVLARVIEDRHRSWGAKGPWGETSSFPDLPSRSSKTTIKLSFASLPAQTRLSKLLSELIWLRLQPGTEQEQEARAPEAYPLSICRHLHDTCQPSPRGFYLHSVFHRSPLCQQVQAAWQPPVCKERETEEGMNYFQTKSQAHCSYSLARTSARRLGYNSRRIGLNLGNGTLQCHRPGWVMRTQSNLQKQQKKWYLQLSNLENLV